MIEVLFLAIAGLAGTTAAVLWWVSRPEDRSWKVVAALVLLVLVIAVYFFGIVTSPPIE